MFVKAVIIFLLFTASVVTTMSAQDEDPATTAPHNFLGAQWTIDDYPDNWEIVWEIFSLPLSDAIDLKRTNLGNEKLYQELVQRLEKRTVKQEEFTLLKTISGATVHLQLAEEFIYPTEWEAPEIPNKIKKVPADPEMAKLLMTPATPSAFDTKNLGSAMEVEISVLNPFFTQLRLKLWTSSLIGFENWGQGFSKVKVPVFTAQKLNQMIEIAVEKPVLIGTISPPMSKQEDDREKEVWLSFITVVAVKS